MSFPRYPAYKDSGVDGLGELPSHWALTRLKFVATVQTGVAKGKDNAGKETLEVPYLRVANVQDGYLALDDVASIEIPLEDLHRYRLQSGDVLMNEGGDFDKLGRGHVWDGSIDPCIHQNHVFAVRPHGVSSAWLNLVTGSNYAQFFFMARSKQSTNLASISSSNVMELPVLLPPAAEQVEIANLLDQETAKIEALVAEQERLIELLKEKRQAVISHAVTKGLDPSVPMKDSGVEWLGEVPVHWEVSQLRYVVREGTSITYGIVQAGPEVDDGIPYIRTSDMSGDALPLTGYPKTSPEIDASYARSKVSAGDLVISIRASVGKCLPVPPELDGANLTQGTAKIAPSSKALAEFMLPFIGSSAVQLYLDSKAKGATFKEITLETLRKTPFLVPPVTEQEEIGRWVDRESQQFQALIEAAEQAQALLRERRTALISAAVTGQIDVRGWAPAKAVA